MLCVSFFVSRALMDHSSLIASTGLMLMALKAGASPARMPNTLSKATAPMAVQKLI